MTDYRWLATLLACLVMPGCTSLSNIKEDVAGALSSKGHKELDAGVKAYEDGEYREATKLLQSSLDAGLRGNSNQIKAHKYLAFINCVSNRVSQCRDEFRKALDIDPAFELSEDEIGHPIWGPAFRSVKAKR